MGGHATTPTSSLNNLARAKRKTVTELAAKAAAGVAAVVGDGEDLEQEEEAPAQICYEEHFGYGNSSPDAWISPHHTRGAQADSCGLRQQTDEKAAGAFTGS